jgi:membrane protein required for colicin V production
VAIFDLVVAGIVLVSAAIGAWRGLVGEALAMIAWALAIVAAWMFGGQFADAVFGAIKEPALRALAGYGTLIVVVLAAVALLKLLLRQVLKALGMSITDRVLGVVFGLVRGTAIILVLVAAGGLTSAPKQAWWKEARTSAPLETVVLALRPMLPADIAKRIRY